MDECVSLKKIVYASSPGFVRRRLQSLENSPLAYRFAKGTFWSLVGALVSKGLGLLSSILVARMLGKSGFGELGIIQSTVGMFSTFASFGLGLTATKFIAEFRATDPVRAGRVRAISSAFAWITSSLTTVILFFIAPWLAEHSLSAPQLTDAIRIGTIYLFLSALNGAQTGALAGFEAFKTSARINVVSGLANFPLMVCGVYWYGLNGALWGMALATGFNWSMNHLAIRRLCRQSGIPYSYKGCWQERKLLWQFSIPAFLGSIMTGPVIWLANTVLTGQANGYEELGVYNAVLRIKQVPEMILAIVMAPILPILSELYSKRSSTDYSKTLNYAFGVSVLVMVPFSLLQMASPELTLLPYGSAFHNNDRVVQWLMAQTIFIGCFSPVGHIISSLNKMWLGLAFNLVWGATYLGLSYFIIPQYGGTGLAAAFTLAHLVLGIISYFYILNIKTDLDIKLPILNMLLLITLLMVVCFVASSSDMLILRILMGCLTSMLLITRLSKWRLLKR
jgi:O-antigen/teichoic acid export membrane protein